MSVRSVAMSIDLSRLLLVTITVYLLEHVTRSSLIPYFLVTSTNPMTEKQIAKCFQPSIATTARGAISGPKVAVAAGIIENRYDDGTIAEVGGWNGESPVQVWEIPFTSAVRFAIPSSRTTTVSLNPFAEP